MEASQTVPTSSGSAAESAAETPRRGFFCTAGRIALGGGFALLGFAGCLWTLGIGRFLFPNVVNQPPNRFRVGRPGDYPRGKVETRYKEEYGVWVVHGEYRGTPQIYALRTVCTHLGCITIWQEAERKFKCPCHGSGFRADGLNCEGPAPRPLERLAIRIADDGQLEVDRSRVFQEELGQWQDPESYVSV
ncbi:MAG: ubiquinol-cytochrome c reductase iron-sulfur subunit [Pirellulaceae bacterium]|jgi:cytochrome b6-f complex iron-sulfur subunit|nr:ubiquinol-cytochrome c reductase iron-sulfur subunit [Thermoguttaceae bacterium]NLY99538.1 ubiquinol-cytochrome c reductase iron-sulfur subunit [Pirellulaceae bacterium]